MQEENLKFNPEVAKAAMRMFGDFVKQRRLQLQLSVYTICTRAGIHRDSYMAIENGEGYTMQSFLAVCGILRMQMYLADKADPDTVAGIPPDIRPVPDDQAN